MNSKTKKLAQTALLLTICLLSQYFKNLSVYITGPVINACLILCVLTAGLAWASILCVVTPITAFFIAGSPIMAGIPLMFPAIMAGNFILVFFTWLFEKKTSLRFRLPAGLIAGSDVRLAGIKVGRVVSQKLDDYYGVVVTFSLPKDIQLPEDSGAAVQSSGLIGTKYIELQPGGAEDMLPAGGFIEFTQDSPNLQSLLDKVISMARADRQKHKGQ